MNAKKSIIKLLKRILRIALWIIGGFIIVSIGLSLLLLIPPIQKYAVGEVTDFISAKTNMKTNVGGVHIGFPKTINLNDIYIEDLDKDTLFYCRKISINTDLIPLILKKLNVDDLRIDGLKGKVKRNSIDSTFNFSPLLQAFASESKPKKESLESEWEIGFDELTLSEIHLFYENQIDSTSINFVLGYLEILTNSSNIIKNEFDLKSIAIGQISLAMVIGDKTKNETILKEKKESPPMPIFISLEELNVKDVEFDLQFTSGKLGLSAVLKEAHLRPDLLDLQTQTITLKEIIASEIDVALKIRPIETSEETISQPIDTQPNFTFGDFDWNFFVDHAEFSDTRYKMDLNEEPRQVSGMDYMHMNFFDFNVVADSLYFDKDKTGASVSSLSLKEISGPEVQNVKGTYSMDNHEILGKNIELKTAQSQATGKVALTYPAMRLIGKKIQQFGIESEMQGSIRVSEIQPFTSVLDNYPLLQQVKTIEVKKFISEGVLGNLKIPTAEVAIGSATFIRASGKITGLPSTNITLSYNLDTLFTNLEDLNKLIPDTLLPADIHLPQTVVIKSMGKTDLSSGNITAEIVTDIGQVYFEGILFDDKLSTDLELANLNIGKLLNDSTYGEINLESRIEAKITDNALTNLASITKLTSVEFNDYVYRNSELSLDWKDGAIDFDAYLSDTSLLAELKGQYIEKDSVNHVNFLLSLEKSNLQQLKFTDDYFSVTGDLNVDMDIVSADVFKGLIEIENVDLTKSDNSFHIDALRFESDINERYTNFNFRSEILDAEMTGNTKIAELKDAFIDHLDLFIKLPDSIINQKDFNFEINLELKKPDLFTKFLIEDLGEIQLEKCHLKYDDAADILEAEVIVPRMIYKETIYDNLRLVIDSKSDLADVTLALNSITADYASINNLELHSVFTNQQSDFSFSIHDLSDSLKYQLSTRLNYEDSIYKMAIDPERTIINYENWEIPKDNYLQILDGKFSAQSAQMSNGDQKFWLDSKDNEVQLNLENFHFQNLSNILEHDSVGSILGGKMDGFVQILNPLTKPKITAQFDVPNLTLLDEYLGNLHAYFSYGQPSQSEFNVKLQNNENFIYASGSMSNSPDNSSVNIILESDLANAAAFQPLVNKYVNDLEGGLRGRLAITSEKGISSMNGSFTFDNLSLTLKETNTQLKNSGQIIIEDNLVRFESFEIRDMLNNIFAIKGNIDLKKMTDPHYDLMLKSESFLAINSKPTDNQIVFGKLDLGTDIQILGNQSSLKVTSKFKINEDTDITYIMPGKELELITDEGIVEFVNFNDQSYQLAIKEETKFIGDSIVALVKGIDFSASLSIDPKAKFTIIVDPNSGDFTEFKVNGKLAYKYNETQRGMLTGLVEFEEGFYELSFYGLVKKRFIYSPGSTISWAGEVMNGDINFAARHTVRTNSVGLVSNEISSYERTMYNQRLPYDVILKVGDKINYPAISFEIDLPERDRSTYPTLDSKLNILNQPSMESERNKQVFALLVGGTFIPENPEVNEGSSSDNFATTAARNSVNAIMTQQLNKLTGQIIQGLDVDMGVNTFDDYGSGTAQTRTQLDVKVSKNLFNDRMAAEMQSHIDLDGSVQQVGNQSTAGMTEFAVSYKLTETGNYRIRAFRENAYDIFDGEIQNSGIAFIFVREFDSFKKRKMYTPEVLPEEEDKIPDGNK